MPDRTPHTVYVAVEIEAYDWLHATECVRAEIEAMDRAGEMSPMFEEVTTLNITGREERLELCGHMYYRELPHNPRDLDLLRDLQGAYLMGFMEQTVAGLRESIKRYYQSVTGRSIEPS